MILSYYGPGFHLEPHVDVNIDNRENDPFYFNEKVYGIVIEPDEEGNLYFVKWDEEGLPPLGLEPVYNLSEKVGSVFCLEGPFRHQPYFHGVSDIKNRRISITFRTVVKMDE